MAFEVDYGAWGGIFAVPCAVADRYLKQASEQQLKVLLLVLRAAPAPADLPEIARRLGLTEAQAGDCLEFWREAGLFRVGPDVPVAQPQTAAPAPAASPAPAVQAEVQHTADGQTVVTTHSRSKLTPAQINAMMRDDPALPVLLGELQKLLGKTLSPAETESLAYLYSAWNLAPDYILMVAQYYIAQGKPRLPYIESRIAEWLERGIDTHERAEAEILRLTRLNEHEGSIRAMFGIGERTLSRNEKTYIEAWFETLGTSPALIKLAYDKAVDNTGKAAFPYINKILTEWHRKGIATPEAAEAESNPKVKAKSNAGESIYNSDELRRLMELNMTGGK